MSFSLLIHDFWIYIICCRSFVITIAILASSCTSWHFVLCCYYLIILSVSYQMYITFVGWITNQVTNLAIGLFPLAFAGWLEKVVFHDKLHPGHLYENQYFNNLIYTYNERASLRRRNEDFLEFQVVVVQLNLYVWLLLYPLYRKLPGTTRFEQEHEQEHELLLN